MKATIICTLLLLMSFTIFSQDINGSVQGKVVDASSNEALIGVTVMLKGTQKGNITDENGEFKIDQIKPGSYRLILSFVGLGRKEIDGIEIQAGQSTELGVLVFKESTIALNEVVITPGSYSLMGNALVSRQTLTSENLKAMSFSEDLTRAVTRLPGVASNDFSSKFTVRGGEDNEVLMLLDGMELYEPFHQRDFAGGLFSIVDIETISGIDLITGGFAANYGQRQSGVFDMRTKTPEAGQKSTSIGLSVMNARFYTDGTSTDNRVSYLFSARRGMLDQSLKLLGEDEMIPKFHDIMGKVNYRLNDKHSLSVHVLYAGDDTGIRDISEDSSQSAGTWQYGLEKHNTTYTNIYNWFTWKAAFTPSVFKESLFYWGSITHNRQAKTIKDEYSDKLNFNLYDYREYQFIGFKQDWTIDLNSRFILKSGYDIRKLGGLYDYNYQLSDIRVNSADSLIAFNNAAAVTTEPSGWLTAAYITGKYELFSSLFMETGIRHDYASYTGDNLISPRVSITYAISRRTFLRGAWGQYYQSQFMNNLDVNHEIKKFDPAELSTHYILGVEHKFSNDISLRVEGYYKDISNLSRNYQNLRDPWETFPESRNDQIRLSYDGARSKGIEFFLKYDEGEKISWWFSYALANTSEKITNLEFEGVVEPQTGWLPRVNNQKHTVYADINYRPNNKWDFNLSGQYYVGLPMTIYDYEIVELTDDYPSNQDLHFYPRHLKFRDRDFPAYHRIDLRTNRNFDLKKGQLTAYLHLVNVYNRENMRKFDLDATNDKEELAIDGDGNYIETRDDATWFGFLPVMGLSWNF